MTRSRGKQRLHQDRRRLAIPVRRRRSRIRCQPRSGARHKLNVLHVQLALFIAVVLGIGTGSLLVFLIVLTFLLISAVVSRDIRR